MSFSPVLTVVHYPFLPRSAINFRLNEDGSHTVVWKSTKIDNSLNPIWAPAKIPMSALCNGDVHRPLRIEIFDWDKSGKHQSMGVVSHTVLLSVIVEVAVIAYAFCVAA